MTQFYKIHLWLQDLLANPKWSLLVARDPEDRTGLSITLHGDAVLVEERVWSLSLSWSCLPLDLNDEDQRCLAMNMEQLPTSRVVSICLSRTLLTCAQQRLDADPPHTPMTAIPIDVEWRCVASDATSSVNPCLGVFLPSHLMLFWTTLVLMYAFQFIIWLWYQ